MNQPEPNPVASWNLLRRWFGPLGRYRPSLFRMDMAVGFRRCGLSLPTWIPRWTSPEDRLLAALDLRGQVVLDIGAHTGAYTLFFSRQVGPDGTVIAFEPQPDNYARLARNLEMNAVPNAQALKLALGADSGRRPLFWIPGMATTASLATEACTPLRMNAGEAQIERLDALVAGGRIPPPDFVKIDVEGFELDVLRGGAETLRRCHPALLVEIHGASRGDKRERVREVVRMLQPLGYGLTHAESGRAVGHETPGIAAGHLFARCPLPVAS